MENMNANYEGDKVPIPVYFRLQTILLQEIENGRWRPDTKIPTEKELSNDHHVSIGTVKKAISNLVNEGYLYRIQGKGTFVAGKTLRNEELICPYFHFKKHFMDQESEITVQFLDLKIIEGFEPASQFLNLKSNQRLFELRRLYLLDKKPMAYNVCYLPQKKFSGLDKIQASVFEEMPLCNILEKNYGKPELFKQELFGATRANAKIAALLNIEKSTPLLFIEMLAFTYKNAPFEYRRSYCLATERMVSRKT